MTSKRAVESKTNIPFTLRHPWTMLRHYTLMVKGRFLDFNRWCDQAGLSGFEKSRGAADITISNVKIKRYSAPKPPDTQPVENIIKSKPMDVTVDRVFPRIVKYKVGDKVMSGQEALFTD
ncbi:hypothetical protein ACT7DA_16720 [Bacillus pacificus]